MSANYSKTILGLIFIAIACFTSSSCQTVKYGHPGTKAERKIVEKVYEKNGVGFLYPKDWQIVEDKIFESKTILISIADAPFCVVTIKIISSEIPIDLRKEAESVDKKLQTKMPVEKAFEDRVSNISRNFQGRNQEGIRLKSSFSTDVATIPDTTDFLLIKGQKSNALIILNSDDADWKTADKEFQFILDSLKFE